MCIKNREGFKTMLDNTKRGFSIVGVYHVQREAQSNTVKNRRFTSIAFRLKGNGRFLYNGEEILADANSMIYIPTGIDYNVHRSADELIIVHLQCYHEVSRRIEVLNNCADLRESFLRLHAEWESADPILRHNRCMSILYSIFENAQKMIQKSDDAAPSVIRPGVLLLHSDFKNPSLTVSRLAAACHVSEVYFRRLYKAHFGTSPLESILDLRFSYAKSLLRSGYYSTKAVAAMSGFTDVKYFRTEFTKRVGVTPGGYRNTYTSVKKIEEPTEMN